MNDLIKTDNSKVIESLQNRVAELEGYNVGLANESCKQQERIAELEATLESVNECFGGLYVKKQIEKLKEQGE